MTTTEAGGVTGTFSPRPGAAPLPRMIRAQAALETRMLLRNGEQLLLTVIIPTLLLVLFSAVDIIAVPTGTHGGAGRSVDFLAPGILALAVLSTAFTGQAIATGFERRYGVLKRLAVSPLPRWGLMTAKTCAVLVTEVLQIALLTAVALALGWTPQGSPLAVVLLLLLGTAAFSGLGLLMAGDAQGGGHPGRGQPGVPAAAGRRRGGHPAGEVPGGRPERARAAADHGTVRRAARGAPARRRYPLAGPRHPGRMGGAGARCRGAVLPLGVSRRTAVPRSGSWRIRHRAHPS